MSNDNFELRTQYEEMALKLELAKTLLVLLFDEIDDMYKADRKKNAVDARLCCGRWNIFDSLTHHVFDDITAVAKQLDIMAGNEEVG